MLPSGPNRDVGVAEPFGDQGVGLVEFGDLAVARGAQRRTPRTATPSGAVTEAGAASADRSEGEFGPCPALALGLPPQSACCTTLTRFAEANSPA